MKTLIISILLISSTFSGFSQLTWKETDKAGLLENFIRTRKEINVATQNLSLEQWTFKEDPTKWSIACLLYTSRCV